MVQAADHDLEKAQRGIVFIDEIDKKAKKSEGNSSITRDVSGEGVQQALLKIIEGDTVFVPPKPGRKNPAQEMIPVNTKDILFIVGGAFVGLEDIIAKAKNKGNTGIGLTKEPPGKKVNFDVLKEVEPEHLKNYGLIPELVGRLQILATLEELSLDQLKLVMTEPKNAVTKQFSAMLGLDGVELEFTEEGIEAIAKLAKKHKTGARGLRSIIEDLLMDTRYELPELKNSGVERIVIDEQVVNKIKEPIKIFKNPSKKASVF